MDTKKEEKTMKVFVWKDVLTDYTSGMMIAIAPSLEEAREQLLIECGYISEIDLNSKHVEFPVTEKSAFVCWGGG